MDTPWKTVMGEASCKEVVQDLFHLKNMEITVLCDLAKHGTSRMEDIAQRTGRDKSSAHRALQKLLSCGLIYQSRNTLPRGGYYYTYRTPAMETMKERLLSCVEDWYKSTRSTIEEFEGFEAMEQEA